ncbi:hypothetical protein ACQCVK_05075 [Rossellomorea vietnamensis]|uniref:hypothetical protein n=1 Tax=Rossellomorea vietnamensis TaxID=218284 RepID=UPI003CE97090
MTRRLDDKFTVEEMKALKARINKLFYNTTHWKTRSKSTETERELINSIDYLCRVSGMLTDMIYRDLEGHIETSDPMNYIDSKMSSAENWMNNYLHRKNINLSEDN